MSNKSFEFSDNYSSDPDQKGLSAAQHMVDSESQYKIANKKQALIKKLDLLKRDDDEEEVSKVVIDQVTNLVDEFEQEYKNTMQREV